MSLRTQITEDMKSAMRAREATRLGTIRMLLAALKQREVDERIELSDADVLAIVDKEIKKRRDSISQFEKAGREDLASIERAEVDVMIAYLPQQLTEAEIGAEIDAAIVASGAAGPGDMGRLMAILRPRIAGRADMGKASAMVKARLAG
jgi:uncharacterized protein YqeY